MMRFTMRGQGMRSILVTTLVEGWPERLMRARCFMVGLTMRFIGGRYFVASCRNYMMVLVMVVLMRELGCTMHRSPVRSVKAGSQLCYDGRAQGPAHVDRVLLGLAVSVPLILTTMIYVASMWLIFPVSAIAMAAIAVVIVAIVVLRITVAAAIMAIVSVSTVHVPGAVIKSKSEPVSTLGHCKQQPGKEKQLHPRQNSIAGPPRQISLN